MLERACILCKPLEKWERILWSTSEYSHLSVKLRIAGHSVESDDSMVCRPSRVSSILFLRFVFIVSEYVTVVKKGRRSHADVYRSSLKVMDCNWGKNGPGCIPVAIACSMAENTPAPMVA